jgi:hypothetical protein
MSTGTRPVYDGWKVKGSLASLQHLTVGVEGFRNASTWMLELLMVKQNVVPDGVFMNNEKTKEKTLAFRMLK